MNGKKWIKRQECKSHICLTHVLQDCSSRKTGPAWCGGLPVRAYLVAWHGHRCKDQFHTQIAEASSSWYTEFTCPLLSHDPCCCWRHAMLWQCLMIATCISVFGGCRHLNLSGVSQWPLCCCDAAVVWVGRKT